MISMVPTPFLLPSSLELCKQFDRSHLFAIESYRDTLFEVDVHVSWFVWSIFWSNAQYVDRLQVFVPRIFQFTAFVADVPDVLVAAVDFLSRLADRNVVFLCIFNKIFSGVEVPESPWSDDLDRRIQSLDRCFETLWSFPFPVQP